MAIFQYQGRSVGPLDAPTVADDPIEWYQQHPSPVLPIPLWYVTNELSEPIYFVPDTSHVHNSNVQGYSVHSFQYQSRSVGPIDFYDVSFTWYKQHPDPARRIPLWYITNETFEPIPFVPDTGHVHNSSVQGFSIHSFQYQSRQSGPAEFFGIADTSIEWYAQQPDPVRRKKRPGSAEWFAGDQPLDPENTSTEWYMEASQPLRRARRPASADWSVTNHPLDPENVSFEWFAQHPQPTRRIPDTGFRTGHNVELTPPGLSDISLEWYMQQPIPVLRIVSVANLFTFTGDVLRARRRGVAPPLVQHDPKTDPRSVRHEQYVARIMNSLLLQGEIVQETGVAGGGKWHLGVFPTNFTDWVDDDPPTTLTEALDRIAAVLAALGLKP